MITDERVAELESRLAVLEQAYEALNIEKQMKLSPPDPKLLEGEFNRLSMKLGWINNPQLYFGAMPNTAIQLSGIFESQSTSAVKAFEMPQIVREEGFGFYSAQFQSKLVDGNSREAVLNSQARRVTEDGKIVSLFSGGDDFLGWGMRSAGWAVPEQNKNTPLQINSLVLIEATFNFVSMARALFAEAHPSPESMVFVAGYKYLKNSFGGPSLLDGKADRNMYMRPRIPSEDDGNEARITVKREESVGRTAFRLIAGIYHRFNLTDNKVPYTLEGSGHREIDPTQF